MFEVKPITARASNHNISPRVRRSELVASCPEHYYGMCGRRRWIFYNSAFVWWFVARSIYQKSVTCVCGEQNERWPRRIASGSDALSVFGRPEWIIYCTLEQFKVSPSANLDFARALSSTIYMRMFSGLDVASNVILKVYVLFALDILVIFLVVWNFVESSVQPHNKVFETKNTIKWYNYFTLITDLGLHIVLWFRDYIYLC